MVPALLLGRCQEIPHGIDVVPKVIRLRSRSRRCPVCGEHRPRVGFVPHCQPCYRAILHLRALGVVEGNAALRAAIVKLRRVFVAVKGQGHLHKLGPPPC